MLDNAKIAADMHTFHQIWPQLLMLAFLVLIFASGISDNAEKRRTGWPIDLGIFLFFLLILYAGGFWTPMLAWLGSLS